MKGRAMGNEESRNWKMNRKEASRQEVKGPKWKEW
jgi:hypothetical protein